MKELETTKIHCIEHTTPERLKILGIQLCKQCGHHMSRDNMVCYGCGFDNDDQYINETVVQEMHGQVDIDERPLYLVTNSSEISKKKREIYHIMKSGFSLCGLAVDIRNRFLVIGKMNLSRIPEFYKNPCKECLDALENQNQ